MHGMFLGAAVATAMLVSIHLLAGRFHNLVGTRPSATHSFLAGITTAYLFLKLLPDLGAPGAVAGDDPQADSRRLSFAIALFGFVAFYGAEVWAHRPSGATTRAAEESRVYRLLLVTFALFNAGLAFLLPHQIENQGFWGAATYVVAIGVHLLVLDHAIAEVHGGRYGIRERVTHSAGLVAGLTISILLEAEFRETVAQPLTAFLGGAIALQIFREEIPAYKSGRPFPFAAGAVTLGVVLVVAERI